MRKPLIPVLFAAAIGLALTAGAGAQEQPPAAPTGLFAYNDVVDSAIWLSWIDNADKETSYIVERSVVGTDGPWDALATTPTADVCRIAPNTCWYFDYDFEPPGDDWYRVAAVNDGGQSAYSNVTQARRQPQPGHVRGIVFHDRDADGTLDPGEEGVPYREVRLEQGGRTRESGGTGEDGTFTLEADAGTYDLYVEVGSASGICMDGGFTLYPLTALGCTGTNLPWTTTTPGPVPVMVPDGGTIEISVGARPIDAAVYVGLAVLEADWAPPGTRIEALVNGRVCGTTMVDEGGSRFAIEVLGERESPGCARREDVVSFRVGGVPAAETATWVPFTQVRTLLQFEFQDLVAMEDHAWYWMQVPAAGMPGDGATVLAMVGDTICGETVLQTSPGPHIFPGPPIAGFSKLVVPSEGITPGCGYAGATVTFTIDGQPAGSIGWQPGLQEVELGLRLPDTGTGSQNADEGWSRVIAMLAIAVVLVTAGRLLVALRP